MLDSLLEELCESFINGNKNYVAGNLLRYNKQKLCEILYQVSKSDYADYLPAILKAISNYSSTI
jgi:hypothetical protein